MPTLTPAPRSRVCIPVDLAEGRDECRCEHQPRSTCQVRLLIAYRGIVSPTCYDRSRSCSHPCPSLVGRCHTCWFLLCLIDRVFCVARQHWSWPCRGVPAYWHDIGHRYPPTSRLPHVQIPRVFSSTVPHLPLPAYNFSFSADGKPHSMFVGVLDDGVSSIWLQTGEASLSSHGQSTRFLEAVCGS